MAKSEPLKSTFSIRSLLDQNDHQGIDANNDVSDEANDEAVSQLKKALKKAVRRLSEAVEALALSPAR